MDTLLTISIGQYSAVELMLKLCVALMGMLAFLLVASVSCVPREARFPLLLGGGALAVATWFESGVWIGWREAFELAGTSYCVTGQLLAGEDRVLAWAVGVPLILLSLGMTNFTWGKAGNHQLERLAMVLLLLAVTSLFSITLALLTLACAGWLLCIKIPRSASNSVKQSPISGLKWALLSILLSELILVLSSYHFIPTAKTADATLVRGEIIRGVADLLSFVIPGVTLLMSGIGFRTNGAEPVSNPLPQTFSLTPLQALPNTLPVKEKKSRAIEKPDPQTGLFG